jgi:adhesin/invasin
VATVDSALAIVAESDPVAANTRVTALVSQLTGRAGELLPDSVAVRVTDSVGRALPDIPVRWTVDDGGVVEALATRTDTLGVVRAHWTLARKTGAQTLRAQVGVGSGARGIPPVTITAVALAGAPTGVVVASGEAQRGAAGSALAKPIVLRVVDANGSGVANANIQLAPSAGSVPDSALTTDAHGMARVRWTMGRSAGEQSLAVRVEGVKALLKVAAHATPAAPANLSFDDAPPTDKHAKTKERGHALYAVVTDVYGNPVPDAPMTFTTKSGTVTPARAVSDTRGRAALTWTPGTRAGEHTLTGAVRSTDVKGSYTVDVGAAHEAAPRATSSRSIPIRKDKR